MRGEITTIPIKKETRDALLQIGTKAETWDDLINRLVKESKEQEKITA